MNTSGRKVALLTGITGQDGSYLAEFLLERGYDVHGIIRRSSSFNTARIDHIFRDPHDPESRLHLHYGDLADGGTLSRLIRTIQPEEIYNLGAQSHVRVSFDIPEYTANTTALGALRILEIIREFHLPVKYYQASSSEMFGHPTQIPQNEGTPLRPVSPYGIAKAFAYQTTKLYREAYGIFAVNGILFNHESPRRGETFVSRKITRGIAKILAGMQSKIFLGNLDAKRDWGYAPEYVEGMWRMLQHQEPDDYVLATGETHSVREFLEEAFGYVGLDWKKYIEIDPRYFRPKEISVLIGDASKAERLLGWKPKVTFRELVHLMVDADCKSLGISIPHHATALSSAIATPKTTQTT